MILVAFCITLVIFSGFFQKLSSYISLRSYITSGPASVAYVPIRPALTTQEAALSKFFANLLILLVSYTTFLAFPITGANESPVVSASILSSLNALSLETRGSAKLVKNLVSPETPL